MKVLENLLMNNKAELTGELVSEFLYSHESFGETFYIFTVKVPRLSDCVDYINVTSSADLLSQSDYKIGDILHICGQFRSYNNYSGVGSKLVLTLFAKSIFLAPPDFNYVNQVELDGYICKPPMYRTTPFGREITDILLAVNRTHNKSDYIPCIAWGKNARITKDFDVGSHVNILGRMQSRQYQKRIDDNNVVTKTAYEISVNKIENLE